MQSFARKKARWMYFSTWESKIFTKIFTYLYPKIVQIKFEIHKTKCQ